MYGSKEIVTVVLAVNERPLVRLRLSRLHLPDPWGACRSGGAQDVRLEACLRLEGPPEVG